MRDYVGQVGKVVGREKGSAASLDNAWIHQLAEFRDEWEIQRAMMETQLDLHQKTLRGGDSPESGHSWWAILQELGTSAV